MITAMLITMLMLSVTLSAIGFVDQQTRESGKERKRESTFQLSEGVLNSQIFLLSREWPGTSARMYPTTCSKTNQSDARCPDTTTLANAFKGGVDYKRGIDWTTEVRDNTAPGASNYYDDAFVLAQPRWDANRDGFMWVRAQGTLVNGRQRAIVALVRAEKLITNFPRHAVVAGSIDITQNGAHEYVYTSWTGPDGKVEDGRVVLRCSPNSGTSGDPCVNEKRPENISPARVESDPTMSPALTAEAIERLRETARASGTYFGPGQCPATLTGELIFIENPTTCPSFGQSGTVYNSAEKPGVVVVGSGFMDFRAGTFYGLVYHVNGSDGVGTPSSGTVFSTKSGGVVVGQVIIDGNGRLEVGNNNGGPGIRGNITFDPRAGASLQTFGTAGIVQNSFREIQPRKI